MGKAAYQLRKFERLLRKKGENTADVEFLRKCLIIHGDGTPVFLSFKLNRTEILQGLRRVNSLRQKLMLREVRQHRTNLCEKKQRICQK